MPGDLSCDILYIISFKQKITLDFASTKKSKYIYIEIKQKKYQEINGNQWK